MSWIPDAVLASVLAMEHAFSSEGVIIACFIQLLRDHALTWAQAVVRSNPVISYADFFYLSSELCLIRGPVLKQLVTAYLTSSKVSTAFPVFPLRFGPWRRKQSGDKKC